MDIYVVKLNNDVTFGQINQAAKAIKSNVLITPVVPPMANTFEVYDESVAKGLVDSFGGSVSVISYDIKDLMP